MQQIKLFNTTIKTETLRAHGGILSKNKRRSRRPMDTKKPLHVTLRSDFAFGGRSLLKNKNKINLIIKKASHRFRIKVYEKAICANHIHLLICGKSRVNIQNFFRMIAGHIAQEILREFPITEAERKIVLAKRLKKAGGALPRGASIGVVPQTQGCKKNQRKFWDLLVYSRIVTWGKEFKIVTNYIMQNTLEALNIIAYQPRKRSLNTS